MDRLRLHRGVYGRNAAMAHAPERASPRMSGRRGLRRRRPGTLDRLSSVPRLMLISGVVMMLISLAAMETGRRWLLASWRQPPIEALLLASLLLHMVLAFRILWQKRSLRLPPIDIAQFVLGFAIPPRLGHWLARRRPNAAAS